MSTVANSISIARPIEEVFAVLTDVERTALWFPADIEERWTSPPPHGVGSTRRARIRMFGRTAENDAIVTEFRPADRVTIEGTTPNAPFITTLAFAPTPDGGTRVDVTTTFRFAGAQRLAGPLFAGWYRRAWDRGLRVLRDQLEAGTL